MKYLFLLSEKFYRFIQWEWNTLKNLRRTKRKNFFLRGSFALFSLFSILFFVIILSLLFFYSKRNGGLPQKTSIIPTYVPFLKEQEFNPDISTDNWDLHKLRLDKFKRSQYKGLTFFVSSENKIYYLSEEGDKVYC